MERFRIIEANGAKSLIQDFLRNSPSNDSGAVPQQEAIERYLSDLSLRDSSIVSYRKALNEFATVVKGGSKPTLLSTPWLSEPLCAMALAIRVAADTNASADCLVAIPAMPHIFLRLSPSR